MSVNYSAGVKNSRMIVVRDAIDVGAPAATMEIGTAGMGSVLATLTLADPASSVAGAVLTFLGTPIASVAGAAGTAAAAQIKDGTGAVIVSGLTVGLAGTDIIITNTSISIGDTVTMTSGTITHS